MMKMFKKDGDPKKVKAAIKKTAKSAMKEGSSEAMQSMTKRVPVSTLKRSVKTVSTPRVTATIQKSTMNSKTGAVTKSAPKKMGMKSITAKEFYK
jgi:hypothetical protein